ncbi:methionine--tRNA ligase [Candidatus Peribacteria bacterium RIFCSPHIGHO2_01_FULL_55_13]|nr:MAG: methionine--tRNA ligase [Candidatus Peribacteria bacterium RIFCSPHIGHO2_01_FULL_55_13]OGJ64798.1 MAG: methionine--tRNA ligase [Candidatus Peribacteria bacterium RIFCSPHIGHO2_12_FULL_55_11]
MARQYITTAIDYPNAAPHMGHVLEKVLADVCARWMRLRGDEVRFQIGTDEHGIKIQQTADKEKITPKALVDRNVPLFEDLYKRLGISSDVFIRTSDQKKHWPTVIELWKRLQKAGMLEKRTYTGLYCSGCERFLTKKDLVDGVCDIHKKPPEEVKEENYFFLLSKEAVWLKKLLKKDYHIIPAFRENETLSLIDQGLEDVSFSRPKSSLAWGIPVPGDEGQTMYVWCDALTNYISGLDCFGLNEGARHERQDGLSRLGVEWWDDATVTHVIGKDIARFHALIWPAMLKHSGVRTPDQLLIHGFLTSEGQKMSKSTGNVVVPDAVLAKFLGNPDPLRFYLSHEVPVGNDGDFSWKRIEELYDSKLRNQLGNLLNRVLVLLQKEGGAIVLPKDHAKDTKQCSDGWKRYGESMDSMHVHLGIQQVFELIATLNSGIDTAKPWTLKGQQKIELLGHFAESLRHAALLLLPFIPATAQKISKQLGVPYAEEMLQNGFVISEDMRTFGGVPSWKTIGTPAILFAPLS